jgi:acyl-CoA thioesterase I
MMGWRHWLGSFLPGAAERRTQVARYAEEWQAANAEVLAGRGPVWVVLGDSTAQGVGASTRLRGYVGLVLDELRRRQPLWRVVNLSRTGALSTDVVRSQLPAMAALPLEPALVTCAVGANDLLWGRRAALEADMRATAAALPAGALLATLPQGLRPGLAAGVNQVIREEAVRQRLVLVDVWARTGPPWAGEFWIDHFHPNDRGYRDWADAFIEALDGVVVDR